MKVLLWDLETKKWKLVSDKVVPEKNDFLFFFDHLVYNFFISDASYFFIFNHSTNCIEFVCPKVAKILKINKKDFDYDFFVNHLTVRSKKLFLKYQRATSNLIKSLDEEDLFWVKYSFYLVFEKENHEKIKVYHQVLPFEYTEDATVTRSLIYHTAVNSTAEDEKIILEIIDYNEFFTHFDKKLVGTKGECASIKLTTIELRVIDCLSKGMTSRQIAIDFGLSELTINTHRKRILKKTNCHSTNELITLAIKQKWL